MDMKSDIRRLNNTVLNNEFAEPASLPLQERRIVSRSLKRKFLNSTQGGNGE